MKSVLAHLLALSTALSAAAVAPATAATGATGVDSLSEEVALAVQGQYLTVEDGPADGPDRYLIVNETYVPIDLVDSETGIESGDQVTAVLEVPPELLEPLSDAALADLMDAVPDDGTPLAADATAAQLVIDAVSEATIAGDPATPLPVMMDAQSLSIADAPDSPGPYTHTLHFAFMSGDDAGVFWTRDDLNTLVQDLTEFWNRESQGVIEKFTYNWDDVIAVDSDAGCRGDYVTAISQATDALVSAGRPVYQWTTNQEQHHLIVISRRQEAGIDCGQSYSGMASMLSAGFASPGWIHVIDWPGYKPWAGVPHGIIGHELGHNFSLLHAAAARCPATSGVLDYPSAHGTCSFYEYNNALNLMGSVWVPPYYPLNIRQKAILGLAEDGSEYDTLASQTSGSEYTLTPLANTSVPGRRGLRITDPYAQGSPVYWVDYQSTIEGGGIEVLRDRRGGSALAFPSGSYDTIQLRPPGEKFTVFNEGETFISDSGTLRVAVLETNAAEARIRVSLDAERPALTLSRQSWDAPLDAASMPVVVDAGGTSWSASSSEPWLSATPASSADRTMTLTTVANTSGSARTGTVTVSAGDSSATVTVTQDPTADDCGGAATLACEWSDVATPATGSLSPLGDSDYWRFTVPSSGMWRFVVTAPETATLMLLTTSGTVLFRNAHDSVFYDREDLSPAAHGS